MADETNTSKTTAVSTMVDATMNDVQRGLAWFICISFIVLIFVWVFRPPVMAPESMAQLNQLVSTLQNILLLAIGSGYAALAAWARDVFTSTKAIRRMNRTAGAIMVGAAAFVVARG